MISKEQTIALHSAVRAALEKVAAEHGFMLNPTRANYGTDDIKIATTFKRVGAGGIPSSFARDATARGLPADCWGKTFTAHGDEYTIKDILPRNRKLPVICMRTSNGKKYKFTAVDVIDHLAKAAA